MKNHYYIKDAIEKIIKSFDNVDIKSNAEKNIFFYKINPYGKIKIFAKKQLDSCNKAEFYVLYLVEVDDPKVKLSFFGYNEWLNSPFIVRVVKLSSIRDKGMVIRAINNEFPFGVAKQVNQYVMVAKDNANNACLYKDDDIAIIPFIDIVSKIKSLDIDYFFKLDEKIKK